MSQHWRSQQWRSWDDSSWQSQHDWSWTPTIPAHWQQTPTNYDETVLHGYSMYRTIQPTAWSRKRGLHGMDPLQVPSAAYVLTWKMCFAPQRRALFRHLNFQTCSEHEVFLAFWLPNVLRATTARNFLSVISPDGSAPAALASLLFDPLEPQIIGENRVFRDFTTFSLSLLWSSLFCSSLLWLFPPLLFHLSTLSEVWLLNFLRSIFCMLAVSKKHAPKGHSR